MNRFARILLVVVVILAGLFGPILHKTSAQDVAAPAPASAPPPQSMPAPTSATISIPGPLRSFLRMAAISQKVSPDEIAPLMARNIFLLGYEGPQTQARETEYLVLLNRYVQQARELVNLAGQTGIIHVSNCEDAKPLLQVLGYRERPDCGQKSTFVETVDPQRAFLTIDSGFPLPDLEKVLQEGKPFAYSVPTSRVPLIFTEADWISASRRNKSGENKDLIDTLIHDPILARLYWAMGRVDRETQDSLRQSPGLKKLYPLAPVLDFYGSRIQIASGRVVLRTIPVSLFSACCRKITAGSPPTSIRSPERISFNKRSSPNRNDFAATMKRCVARKIRATPRAASSAPIRACFSC
jgi:hypothetical protein